MSIENRKTDAGLTPAEKLEAWVKQDQPFRAVRIYFWRMYEITLTDRHNNYFSTRKTFDDAATAVLELACRERTEDDARRNPITFDVFRKTTRPNQNIWREVKYVQDGIVHYELQGEHYSDPRYQKTCSLSAWRRWAKQPGVQVETISQKNG